MDNMVIVFRNALSSYNVILRREMSFRDQFYILRPHRRDAAIMIDRKRVPLLVCIRDDWPTNSLIMINLDHGLDNETRCTPTATNNGRGPVITSYVPNTLSTSVIDILDSTVPY